MSSLRGIAVAIVGGTIGTVAVAALVVGCSGDDTGGGTTDSGGDQAQPDVSQMQDTGRADATDGGRGDVTTGTDADSGGASDGDGGRRDGGGDADANAPDSGDVTHDVSTSDADAAGVSDASDASDAADGKVIPPGLLAYPNDYAAAWCAGIAACCTIPSGGFFDTAMCTSQQNLDGWDLTLPLISTIYSAGNLTFNAAQATTCENALRAWPCGTLGAAENQAILTACTNVLGGTIPIGSTGCFSSFECANGYCNTTTNTCVALAGIGGTCTSDDQCSYIGTLQPRLYCNLFPADGGSPTTGTCAAVQADGTTNLCKNQNVIDDLACTSQLCSDSTSACGGPKTNPTDFFCADIGSGGYIVNPG
jgi:hypothetical protein